MSAIAETLRERELLSEADLRRAEEVAQRIGGRLPATLARLGLVAETDLATVIAETHRLSLAPSLEADAGDIPVMNPRFLARRSLLPLGFDGTSLRVAMADPDDAEAIEAMAFAASALEVHVQVASFSDIADTLIARHGATEDLSGIEDLASAGEADDIERLLETESEAPIIRIVQRLLANAVNRRASDVHIEPMSRHVAVRYRIDGRLIEVERHADALSGPIASRIKVMAALDIAETRLPQDGRLRLTVRGREVDVRVSTSPTVHGESIVMRLLGRTEVPLDLERLGLPGPALGKLTRALARPHGIVLVTGPTGSGKTTTLYAALNRLRRPDVKILTVEDPVEFMLEGINQVQVRPEIELSYAATLRAFLRQDPDILMIGEVRDQETADIAMRAALTGHLVLSTLHTNSAIGAFARLADLGVEPYLTASTVIAAIAQRLVRLLCQECRAVRNTTAPERDRFGMVGLDGVERVYDSTGCESCGHTGFSGRAPLIEIIEVDETLREQIRNGLVAGGEAAAIPPRETLTGHGLVLVAAGQTSLAELARAVDIT